MRAASEVRRFRKRSGRGKGAAVLALWAVLAAVPLQHAGADTCACEDGYTITLSGEIPDFKATGGDPEQSGRLLQNLKFEPPLTYDFELDHDTANDVGCEEGWVNLECGLEYKTSQTNGAWVVGRRIKVKVMDGVLTPANFSVRVSNGGESSDKSQGSDAGSGGGGSPDVPAQENQAGPTANSMDLKKAGLRFSLPLEQLSLDTGMYRSAGVLTWAGEVNALFAKPVHMNYRSPEEFAGQYPVTSPSGYLQEKHLKLPTRLYRVTGFTTTAETVGTFNSSPNTYIREYERLSTSETEAATFGRTPLSWWKVSTVTDGVKIEQSVRGVYRQKIYTSSATGQLMVSDGVREMTTTTTAPYSPRPDPSPGVPDPAVPGDPYVKTEEVRENGVLISSRQTVYETVNGHYMVRYEYEFPDDVAVLETQYQYYPDGQPWWISYPDGSWVVYEYVGAGTTDEENTITYTPLGSDIELVTSHTDTNTLPLWTASSEGASGVFMRRKSDREGSEAIVSLDLSKAFQIGPAEPSEAIVTNTETDSIIDELPLIQTGNTYSYSPAIDISSSERWRAGRPILTREDSGRGVYYTYGREDEVVNGLAAQPVITETRTTGYVKMAGSTSTIDHWQFVEVNDLSEETISKYGRDGLLHRETKYRVGSSYVSAKVEIFTYDNDGKYLSTFANGVKVHGVEWADPVTKEETDAQGQKTTTHYDSRGEIAWTEKAAGGEVPAIRTSYERSGRTTTVRVNGVVTSVTTVDGIGRTVSETDQTGAVTTYCYPGSACTGPRQTTTTLPGGIKRIEEKHLDGSLKSRSGPGWVNEYHSIGVDFANVTYFTISSQGDGTAHTGRQVRTYYDGRGRVSYVFKPSPSPALSGEPGENFIGEGYLYSGDGDLERVLRGETDAIDLTLPLGSLPGRIVSLGATEEQIRKVALGGLRIEGWDGTNNGVLTLDGTDRFTKREVANVLVNGVVYRHTKDYRYPDLIETNALVTETFEQLGFVNLGTTGYSTKVKVIQPSGRSVETTTTVTPGDMTVETVEDDSATTATEDTKSTTINGYLQEVSKAGYSVKEAYVYDGFGRVVKYSDARNAATFSYFDNFQLSEVTDQLRGTVTYEYYPPDGPHAGKVKSVTKPGSSTENLTEETTYTSRGEVDEISGDGAYKQKYGYNQYGERTTLTTYGTTTALTTWTYQPRTGLLHRKTYNDGNGPKYQYTPDGKLAKRTTAKNVITTYDYRAQTRDLWKIGYANDGDLTPDIEFTSNDGFGRPLEVKETKSGADAHINIQTLSYQPHSGAVSTTYASGHRWLSGVQVAQRPDNVGRPMGFDVKLGTTTLSSQAYGYDDFSRLDEVNGTELASTITYVPGSDLLKQVDVKNGADVIHRRSLSVDLLGRTVGVINKAGANEGSLSTVASVGHEYDAAGRRQNARREDGTRWNYAYNNRSEVTGASKRTAANGQVPGLDFGYEYDGIGNRTKAWSGTAGTSGSPTWKYTSNALNQYTGIEHSGRADILTRSDAPVTATVTGASVAPGGIKSLDQFHAIPLVRSSTDDTHGRLSTTTVRRSGVNQSPVVTTWFPPANRTGGKLNYDADGNLLTDGRWVYTWDGENRLVKMTPVILSPSPINGITTTTSATLSFAYDWMGRRIGKITEQGSGTTTMAYAYDHWNPVAEWQRGTLGSAVATTELKRTHLWGLDIGSSGRVPARSRANFQAAGGVGGLIASTWHTSSTSRDRYIPGYDANGNIISWSCVSGLLASPTPYPALQRRDYDPFGNAVLVETMSTDAVADNIPDFGFSTKPQDKQTGLYYYGYRYYDPITGRWPSRDPIEEKGGSNIYGLLSNNAIGNLDRLGMLSATTSGSFFKLIPLNQLNLDPAMAEVDYEVNIKWEFVVSGKCGQGGHPGNLRAKLTKFEHSFDPIGDNGASLVLVGYEMDHKGELLHPIDTGLSCPDLASGAKSISGSCAKINVEVQWIHVFKYGIMPGVGPWNFGDVWTYEDENIVDSKEFEFLYCCCCYNKVGFIESLEKKIKVEGGEGWLPVGR